MPTVRDVLAVKGESLHTIQASSTVLDATRKMNQNKIGALVVMENGRVAESFASAELNANLEKLHEYLGV